MNTPADTVIEVEIANRHLQLKCSPAESSLLRQTASQLDNKISEIQASGQLTGHDRIILMAALSTNLDLALELHAYKQRNEALEQHIADLDQTITAILPREPA